MDNKDIELGIKQMMSGLEKMASGLEKTVTETYSKMSPEEAINFAKESKQHKIEDYLSDINKGIVELKTTLKT